MQFQGQRKLCLVFQDVINLSSALSFDFQSDNNGVSMGQMYVFPCNNYVNFFYVVQFKTQSEDCVLVILSKGKNWLKKTQLFIVFTRRSSYQGLYGCLTVNLCTFILHTIQTWKSHTDSLNFYFHLAVAIAKVL